MQFISLDFYHFAIHSSEIKESYKENVLVLYIYKFYTLVLNDVSVLW